MYVQRIVDQELDQRLSAAGALVIEGARACGKTATARQRAASEVLLDVDYSAREMFPLDPSAVLDGATPRLLDEWQVVPSIWNQVRRAVDDRGLPGQFILTGSAVPNDDVARHTGAGRFATLRMRPMTLYESGLSDGAVSLRALMNGQPMAIQEPSLTVAQIADSLTVGGWPAQRAATMQQGAQAARAYLQQVIQIDLPRLDPNTRMRDPAKVRQLITSIARNISTEASLATLSKDAGEPGTPLHKATTAHYLTALQRLMLVEEQPAWAPHLRSSATLRQAAKHHFVDPSLAMAALNATPDRLRSDYNTFGLMFESLVIRDLRVYSQNIQGQVFHYRDDYGREVDAIVALDDGRWAAFEVKLGANKIEEAAAALTKFSRDIDTSITGSPVSLAVITATGYSHRRADGIDVIPIGALGP